MLTTQFAGGLPGRWRRGPTREAGAAFEFAKARLTGEKLDFGENRKVTVPMH